MGAASLRVLRRDLALAWRQRSDVLSTLVFFVMVVSLFPLGVGPEPTTLRIIAPGVLWVAALLSSMLSLGRLFAADHADGTLEQLLLSPHPLMPWWAPRSPAHWLASGLPLVLMAPVLGLQFRHGGWRHPRHAGRPCAATPALSLLGGVGAALTVGLRGAGVLVALLVIPWCIPCSSSVPARSVFVRHRRAAGHMSCSVR